ncbi:hypothetical protein [Polyangium jinanense]|uniref:Uncharacterized protein n=1 Tax=Polyangium jinanense TaxID=2829994 RepID=A0A9X3XDV1_9BACT|nr:hypothetical protein [Polyangium jinanense]MDC3959547.1 hypothetical protein [Polyangium jinanense]MDC3986146.1 hypothetical protein [Polyangium jinanense]
MARRDGRIESGMLCAALILLVTPAEAYEVSGGVGLGGILVGTLPRFAVSPHAAVAWRGEGGFSFGVDDLCSVLPGTGRLGVGVYNQTSVAFGYAWKGGDFRVGPSFSVSSTRSANGFAATISTSNEGTEP